MTSNEDDDNEDEEENMTPMPLMGRSETTNNTTVTVPMTATTINFFQDDNVGSSIGDYSLPCQRDREIEVRII